MPPRFRVHACLLALAVVLIAAPAGAASPPLVTVNAPAGDVLLAEAALRASAELRAAGFQVQRGDCATALDVTCGRPWPAGVATLAAVVLQRSGEAVVIDVLLARADAPDAVAFRRDVPPGGAAALQPTVIGVCASELVHASLAAGGAAPPPALVPVKPFVDAGAAGLTSVGLAYGVRARVGLFIGASSSWSASLRVVAATADLGSLSDRGAALRQWELIPQFEAGYRFRAGARVQPELSLGAGAHYLTATGAVTVTTNTVWTPFAAAGAGLAFPLGDTWTIHTDLQIMFMQRALEVTNSESPDSNASFLSWRTVPVLSVALQARP